MYMFFNVFMSFTKELQFNRCYKISSRVLVSHKKNTKPLFYRYFWNSKNCYSEKEGVILNCCPSQVQQFKVPPRHQGQSTNDHKYVCYLIKIFKFLLIKLLSYNCRFSTWNFILSILLMKNRVLKHFWYKAYEIKPSFC